MPKEKVRDAIADMLRCGLTDLDPVVALMRRGPAALEELALAAERPEVKQSLIAAVRRQPQRFAATTASLPRSVRQHALTGELLAAVGGEEIAKASLAAWDQGRRDEAAFLADTALALASEAPEALVAAARVAAGQGRSDQSADLYRRALALPLGKSMLGEAAHALVAVGYSETVLAALAERVGDKPDLVAAISSQLRQLCLGELEALRGAVAELQQACVQALDGANWILSLDAAADAPAAGFAAAAAAASDIAAIVSLRLGPAASGASLQATEPAKRALACALADAMASSRGAVLEPVSVAIASVRAALLSARDAVAAIGPDQDERSLVVLHRGVEEWARTALSGCESLGVYLGALARPVSTIAQPVGPLIAALADRARPVVAQRGASLRATADPVPAVRLDCPLLADALMLVITDIAATIEPGDCLSLSLTHDRNAGMISITFAGLHSRPALGPLAEALVARAVSAHGGAFSLDSDANRHACTFALPVAATAPSPEDSADLSPDARMALRAASGLLPTDGDTACFLIGKAIATEAAARLGALLARHLLLPRASWLLASPFVKTGVTHEGRAVPGRKVEELCRAVIDDRLRRRLSDVRAYSFCLILFAQPHRDWPAPVVIPGLSDGDVSALAAGLGELAGLLERTEAADAMRVARSVLALLRLLHTR